MTVTPFRVHSPFQLEAAGRWFLQSGIQEENGGVARFHLTDQNRNAPLSTEITGYAISALTVLWQRTGEPSYRDAAQRAADYLQRVAWDAAIGAMPFETGEGARYSYFFDCGIIVRGLLALYRETGSEATLALASAVAQSMIQKFGADHSMPHPVVELPDAAPIAYDPRWSRSPGCYQLKSALAWWELADVLGQPEWREHYERMLTWSLRHHLDFLPGEEGVNNQRRVMDRLHAYCYFLEALFPVLDRADCRSAMAEGLQQVAMWLRRISPQFQRSDVCAQLLRARIGAELLGGLPLDREAARQEADWAAQYQCHGRTQSCDGGFWFGQADGATLPFMNPVSTAFCLQALDWWQQWKQGSLTVRPHTVI